MNSSKKLPGLLIAVLLLLAGCAAAGATTVSSAPIRPAAANSHAPSPATMSPSMSMSPGESMAGMTSSTTTPPPAWGLGGSGPSKSAQMICGSETAGNVATLMGLASRSRPAAIWADHMYSCTYQLPGGSLVLSVKESPDVATALGYFKTTQARLHPTRALSGMLGLGLPAFESKSGTVAFLKDNMTLQVDASALRHPLGPRGISPTDLAYTLATDVLACWRK